MKRTSHFTFVIAIQLAWALFGCDGLEESGPVSPDGALDVLDFSIVSDAHVTSPDVFTCEPTCAPTAIGQRLAGQGEYVIDNPSGLVIRLECIAVADCDRLLFRVSKRDPTSLLHSGVYHLRLGSCGYWAPVLDQIYLETTTASFELEGRFDREIGPVNEFCVTKVAQLENPEDVHYSWWWSNLFQITQICGARPE